MQNELIIVTRIKQDYISQKVHFHQGLIIRNFNFSDISE